jgi:hypothetical protein
VTTATKLRQMATQLNQMAETLETKPEAVCLPKDPCSFCRAREVLKGVDETHERSRLFADMQRQRNEAIEALKLYVDVYGGADHHPQDCENSERCLQCRADALANEVLRPASVFRNNATDGLGDEEVSK